MTAGTSRALFVVLALLMAIACAGPAQPLLSLNPGAYTLAVELRPSGGAGSPCQNGSITRTTLYYDVAVSIENGDSLKAAAPSAADGTVDARLAASRGAGGATSVSGSITGRASSPAQKQGFRTDLLFGTSGSASMSGQVTSPSLASGSITGSVVMVSELDQNVPLTCSTAIISWQLSPRVA